MKSLILAICFIFLILFSSCNKNRDSENSVSEIQPKNIEHAVDTTSAKKKIVVENFEEFNKKFHSDSLFQVSRVDFPIEGKHVSGFEQYSWNRKNWQFQVIPVAEETEIGEYQHSLVKTDTLITERFWIQDSGFEVERQFKLIGNKWFLIYYNDINI